MEFWPWSCWTDPHFLLKINRIYEETVPWNQQNQNDAPQVARRHEKRLGHALWSSPKEHEYLVERVPCVWNSQETSRKTQHFCAKYRTVLIIALAMCHSPLRVHPEQLHARICPKFDQPVGKFYWEFYQTQIRAERAMVFEQNTNAENQARHLEARQRWI